MSDDGAGADHGPLADGETGKDCAVGAECAAFFQSGRQELFRITLASRAIIVGKSSGRTDEDVIFNGDAVPEKNTTLNGHTISNSNPAFDESVIANIAVFSDSRAGQQMGEGPDPRALADRSAFFDYRLGMMETVTLQCPEGLSARLG